MNEQYYILSLDEPAAPGFCSFNKMYVGTQEQLCKIAGKLNNKNSYPNTAKAIKQYFEGNKTAVHNIAFIEQKVLTPIKIEAELKQEFGKHKWKHINIWGFPYNMKCEAAKIHRIVFKYESSYFRCIRVWLTNLCYEGCGGNWNTLDDGFWGNASVLDVITNSDSTDFVFNNLLYVEEKKYETLHEAVADTHDVSKIEFKRVCDEIFVDG